MIRIILAITAVLYLSSCISTRKAVEVLSNRGKLSEICADSFKIKDSITYVKKEKIDTVYFIADSVRYRDTVICYPADTVIRNIHIPCRSVVIEKTIHDTITVYKENTAKVDYLSQQLQKEKAYEDNIKRSLQAWRRWALRFGLVLLLIVGFEILKFLNKIPRL